MVANERFTDEQRKILDDRQGDQDRALTAMHRLEAALESAAFGREHEWREKVLASLTTLHAVSVQAEDEAVRPDSLLSDIAWNQPRLRNRVRGIRTQYRQLRDTIEAILSEQSGGAPVDSADLRNRLAWILSAIRHVRSRESDLIYEAYFDAFRADLADEPRQPVDLVEPPDRHIDEDS
jgi:ElaB/YqjD/DUF883 family membrane-anchored ribosome-binding protein